MSSLSPTGMPAPSDVTFDEARATDAPLIWLSVLVPAFNQPLGVARIFESLLPVRGRADIEVLVSDDSADDVAASRIAAQCADLENAHYSRNLPALGAVANWNSLLDRARGRYCLLLHHDEELESTADLPALVEALKRSAAPDVLILPCRVIDRPGTAPRLHFPARWAAAVARRFPAYLLRRNLFGPPSSLIVRRECYPRFDIRLRWLVDMEGYYRMLLQARTVGAWHGGGVTSHRDAAHSITATLAGQGAEIEAAEWCALSAIHAGDVRMRWLFSTTPMARCLRAAESCVWLAFRSAYRLRQRMIDALGLGQH